MTSKECLNEILVKEQNINTKIEQIKILKNMAANCTSTISDIPKAKNTTDKMANTICKIVDLQKEVEKETAGLTLLKIQILDLIGKIEVFEQQTVLLKRYFEDQPWEKIAFEMHYTTRWIHILHSRALINLDKIMAKEESI